jgi:5-methyltetrahydropteroyltriglutamate--homocysteine methyltransferase
VVLGLVTTKLSQLEPADDIARRIDQAARYAPLEQLCLSPQCGFSSTVHGNVLTPADEEKKMRLIVDVAQEVWGSS